MWWLNITVLSGTNARVSLCSHQRYISCFSLFKYYNFNHLLNYYNHLWWLNITVVTTVNDKNKCKGVSLCSQQRYVSCLSFKYCNFNHLLNDYNNLWWLNITVCYHTVNGKNKCKGLSLCSQQRYISCFSLFEYYNFTTYSMIMAKYNSFLMTRTTVRWGFLGAKEICQIYKWKDTFIYVESNLKYSFELLLSSYLRAYPSNWCGYQDWSCANAKTLHMIISFSYAMKSLRRGVNVNINVCVIDRYHYFVIQIDLGKFGWTTCP